MIAFGITYSAKKTVEKLEEFIIKLKRKRAELQKSNQSMRPSVA